MVIRPLTIDQNSPFLEESCALCKEPFALGDEIVVCPDDATRHHVLCWELNRNHCTAYGCTGQGEVVRGEEIHDTAEPIRAGVESPIEPDVVWEPDAVESIAFRRRVPLRETANVPGRITEPRPGSKVRTMPSSTFGCAQGCIVLAVALAIVIMSVSCFGLWAIMDYLMLEVFDIQYREPISELFRPGGIISMLSVSVVLLNTKFREKNEWP